MALIISGGKIVIDSSIIYFCLVFFIYSPGQFKKHFVAQKPMHVCFMNHEWNIKVEHSGVKYSLKEYCYIHTLAFSNEISKQNRYEVHIKYFLKNQGHETNAMLNDLVYIF